jgi:hypothetical protein
MAWGWLQGRIGVALGGFRTSRFPWRQTAFPPGELRLWALDFGLRATTISIPNLTRLPRLPRGGLGAAWTNPGHTLVP